jgi:phosphoglycerate kinase
MQTVQPQLIQGKKVLLRLDLDVPIAQGKVLDDFRLEAGMDTLDLCLQYADSVIVMGHIGRPQGEDPMFSVKPIVDWFEEKFAHIELPEGKLHIMENLRFEAGEDGSDVNFAKELIACADPNGQGGVVFINDAFAAHHPAASTTVLPTLLPHAAGIKFAEEVEKLLGVRQNPQKPLIAIIGGAKIEDKLPVIQTLAGIADTVLVGGKLPAEIKDKGMQFGPNILIAQMNEAGTDLSSQSISELSQKFQGVKQVIWAGPMGKYETGETAGSKALAEAIIASGADSIIGGGDTIACLDQLGLLDKFSFVSTGGGAMLELLAKGTLPTIEALT